jgi:hypothetical protein
MKRVCFSLGSCIVFSAVFALTGCDSTPPEGNLPIAKPASEISPTQGKVDQQKFMDGMKGMYKGPPK